MSLFDRFIGAALYANSLHSKHPFTAMVGKRMQNIRRNADLGSNSRHTSATASTTSIAEDLDDSSRSKHVSTTAATTSVAPIIDRDDTCMRMRIHEDDMYIYIAS